MKRICFVTGSRSDYGILAPVMKQLQDRPDVELQIVATNMHLSDKFGHTVDEIEKDGFKVNVKLPSLVEGSTEKATVLSMARVMEGLASAFDELNPDMVVVLGDRYETLAAASAAAAFDLPLTHLHGGETTLGATDDKFRHAITRLSSLHFAATPQYVEKIKSMGIEADRVHHSGAPGAEIREDDDEELGKEFELKTGISPEEPFILLTFHPVTLSPDKGVSELNATLKALDPFINQGYKVVATLPNSDAGGDEISRRIKEWSLNHLPPPFPVTPLKVVVMNSMGAPLFHYAMEKASAIVGNSSAALIEAPSHRLGAVNVGIRQKGRAHGITVLDVPADVEKIENALNSVMSLEMKTVLMGMPLSSLNPYYKEDAAKFISEKILEYLSHPKN